MILAKKKKPRVAGLGHMAETGTSVGVRIHHPCEDCHGIRRHHEGCVDEPCHLAVLIVCHPPHLVEGEESGDEPPGEEDHILGIEHLVPNRLLEECKRPEADDKEHSEPVYLPDHGLHEGSRRRAEIALEGSECDEQHHEHQRTREPQSRKQYGKVHVHIPHQIDGNNGCDQ